MIEIEKPQIECIETPGDASYGKYVIEPLERGYGTTLGNALRRIMLSSLPGTAATSIKIAGVQHEFSTIPGVKEDVTEIVLNVKSLLTKLHCEGTKTVYIEAAGPCEVTAGDIKSDGEVEVLNPELHLATLDVGATLSMEITLSHGRGYVSADRNKAQRPGVIRRSVCRKQDFVVNDTTLFRVMLYFLIVFTKQLFAALVGSGGNSRLAVATLDDGNFIVWTGHFVSLLSDFGQKKSRRPFSDFLLGMPLCERRIFSFESSGQVVPMCGESVKLEVIQ